MAQSLMIIEPPPSACCSGAKPTNLDALKTASAVLSDGSVPTGPPTACNIARRAAHEAQRERELMRANDFYAAVLAMATHDLRQHLQVIVGSFDLLANKLLPDPDRRHIGRGHRASQELTNRFDQLMDALRVQQQFGCVQKEPVRLQPLFERLSRQLAEPARKASIFGFSAPAPRSSAAR